MEVTIGASNLWQKIGMGVLAAVVFMGTGFQARGGEERAKIYRDGNKPETLIYHFLRVNSKNSDGTSQSHITYSYPDGRVAVIEKVKLDASGGLISFEREQKQLNESGQIQVGKKVLFSYTQKGAEKTDSEERVANFLVGPMVASYLQKRWDKILAGEVLETRFGVVDRLETVGFDFQKVREEKSAGEDIVVVRMKPTSFIISALVDPLHFSFRKSDQRLLRIQGRIIPKEKKGDKFVDVDADFIYEES